MVFQQINQSCFQRGLAKSLEILTFQFDLKYDDLLASQFLLDLFNSPEIRSKLPYVQFKKQEQFGKIDFTKLQTNVIKMDLFDKLEQNGIVVNNQIKKQFEEIYEEIEISDYLRAAIVQEESEFYCTFNEQDRNTLLFRLFSLLVLGGQLCQYEDNVQVYLEQTKLLYKSLVNARKDPINNQILIDSFAYNIKKIETGFKSDHPQNILYIVINPSLRNVHIIANKWLKSW